MFMTSQEANIHLLVVGLPVVSILIGYVRMRVIQSYQYRYVTACIARCDAHLAGCQVRK